MLPSISGQCLLVFLLFMVGPIDEEQAAKVMGHSLDMWEEV